MSKMRYLIGAGLFTGGVSAFTYSLVYNVPTTREYAATPADTTNLHFDFTTPFIEHTRDLSAQQLTLEQMKLLAEDVQNNKYIGRIKWPDSLKEGDHLSSTVGTDLDSRVLVTLKQQIDTTLALNNKNYQMYPSDFVYALLSAHTYHDSTDKQAVQFPSSSSAHKYNQYITGWYTHKVYSKPEVGRYYAVSYVHEKDSQLVLSFRGTTFEMGDVVSKDSPITTDLKGILDGNIVPQFVQAYITTKEAAEFAKANHYSFSTTGHSLGAFLAEISLYFTHFDFYRCEDHLKVKAVTFDSPGSIFVKNLKSNITGPDTEFNIRTLDITTYLSAPNFVNTTKQHIGKVYRSYPIITKPNAVSQGFGKSISDALDLEPFWSLFGHSLLPIVDTFVDSSTGKPTTDGKPVKYDRFSDWPVITYSSQSKPGVNMVTQWFKKFYDIKKAASITWYTISTKDVTPAALELMKIAAKDTTLEAILDLLKDVKAGRIDQKEYLKCWEYLKSQSAADGYPSPETLNPTEAFALKYQGKFAKMNENEVNSRKGEFMRDKTVHYWLLQLRGYSDARIAQDRDELVAKQLQNLRKCYEIENEKRIEIAKDRSLTLEQLESWLGRLMMLDPSIIKLVQTSSTEHPDSRKQLGYTFDDTTRALAEIVKEFDSYDFVKTPNQKDIGSVRQARDMIKEEYTKDLKTRIASKDSSEVLYVSEFNNYLHVTYRAACDYMLHMHAGLSARMLLKEAKSLIEDYWITRFAVLPEMKAIWTAAEDKETIYQETPRLQKHLLEMYTKIVYELGRTYIYQGDRKEAVKYFELSKYLGAKLNLFEEHLSDRQGLGIIAGDTINKELQDCQFPQAKVKLTEIIALYSKLKASTKPYTYDYKPNDEFLKAQIPLPPSKDIPNILECTAQLVKYYTKLIAITLSQVERSKYMQEMMNHLESKDQSGLFTALAQNKQPAKKALVYNTLGNSLFTLYDHNHQEFKKLKDTVQRELHLDQEGAKDDLRVIQELFTSAIQVDNAYKSYTKATAYNGLMHTKIKQLQMVSKNPQNSQSLTQHEMSKITAQIEEYRQKRDEINKLLNRSTEYDDLVVVPIPNHFEDSSQASWYSTLLSFACFSCHEVPNKPNDSSSDMQDVNAITLTGVAKQVSQQDGPISDV